MENSILIDNVTINLDNSDYNNTIKVNGNSEINLFNCNINNLDVEILDNSSLTINIFGLIKDNSLLNLRCNNMGRCTLNYSFISNEDYNLNVNTDFLGKESSIVVNTNALNDGANVNVNVDGYVKSERVDNYLDENIRIVNINGGTSSGKPNMFIDTSRVIANHNTTIGSIREDELLYLMGKGLSKENSTKLIVNGFLVKNILNNDLKVKIKEYLSGR